MALVVMAFFASYAIIGPNGISAYGDYRHQLAKREKVLAGLEKRRALLENRVKLLDPAHANPDMVEELVRKDLNVAHHDEVIIPLN